MIYYIQRIVVVFVIIERGWQRLIFAHCTIVSAEMLNFCVRHGYRWIHLAIVTNPSFKIRYICLIRLIPRPISISQLNTSQCLHL